LRARPRLAIPLAGNKTGKPKTMSKYLRERQKSKLGIDSPAEKKSKKADVLLVGGIKAGKAVKLDRQFYVEVWEASPHICQNCGCKLPQVPSTFNFHHLLPKSKYPQFRYTPENIMILCADCHSQAETNESRLPKVVTRRKEVEKLLLK